MKKGQTLRRDAMTLGGWGRGMDNLIARVLRNGVSTGVSINVDANVAVTKSKRN